MFTAHNFGFGPQHATPKQAKTGEEVYFDGSKKNQLNDLKKYLKAIVSDPEKEYYRKEVIKKIISYTTAGIDTSRLYPEIVIASATKDLVQKKLIYLYLSIYSSTNPNFARMAVNTFLKDISNPNPNVRALATRALSNLRFKGRQEYALPAFNTGLNDFAPCVKRSSILGLAKIAVEQARKNEDQRDDSLLSQFYQLLRQEDSSVVCTALEAINEVEQEGISMSRKLTFYLLGQLHRYSDLQLPVVAGFLELYDPKNDQEVIQILTALEPRLKSSNASTVLAIGKIFVKMGKQKPDLLVKLLKTLRKSLLSFLHHQLPQIEYIVLKHIEYLLQTLKTEVFASDFNKFFLGGVEPTYLKVIKIKILRLSTNKDNFSDIVNQFAEYLFYEDVSHDAARGLTQLLVSASQANAKFIAKTVVKTIDTAPLPSICNNSLPFVTTYLRLYPKDFSLFANVFYLLVESAKEEDSSCAVLELLGDFGEEVEDAPELLESQGSILSDKLRISQLRATTKLFLKRPNEMAEILGSLLKQTLSDDQVHLQVKDYAAYIYRGLQSGVDQFKVGFLESRPHKNSASTQPEELQFNTLEVIYGAKEEKWGLDPSKFFESSQLVQQEQIIIEPPHVNPMKVDMTSRFFKLQTQNFDVTFNLTSQAFQQCWQEYQVGSSITRMVNNLEDLNEQNLEELFKMWNITVLASAETEEEIKFYNYCRVQSTQKDLGTACMECCFSKLAETMTLMIKSDDEELAGFVSRYIEEILKANQLI